MPPRNPFFDWIGLDAVSEQLTRIERKVDQLLIGQAQGKELIMSEQEEIANLVKQVEANRDVAQSAAIAIQGMLDRIAEQNRQLADAIANAGSDVSPEIKAAATALANTTAALADAVPHISHAVAAGTKK